MVLFLVSPIVSSGDLFPQPFVQINLAEYSLDRSKGQFDLKKKGDRMTFKAESPEQLSKWITQLQSTLLESKGEGDQVSMQGTEGGQMQLSSGHTCRLTQLYSLVLQVYIPVQCSQVW